VLVRGSTLGDGPGARAVVILEGLRPPELAPLIAHAHGLTARERAVTQLVAQHLATAEIAARLFLSPYTVQDHLKAIFDKVGVRTRGELVARRYFDHYAPRLADGAHIGADRWFARGARRVSREPARGAGSRSPRTTSSPRRPDRRARRRARGGEPSGRRHDDPSESSLRPRGGRRALTGPRGPPTPPERLPRSGPYRFNRAGTSGGASSAAVTRSRPAFLDA